MHVPAALTSSVFPISASGISQNSSFPVMIPALLIRMSTPPIRSASAEAAPRHRAEGSPGRPPAIAGHPPPALLPDQRHPAQSNPAARPSNADASTSQATTVAAPAASALHVHASHAPAGPRNQDPAPPPPCAKSIIRPPQIPVPRPVGSVSPVSDPESELAMIFENTPPDSAEPTPAPPRSRRRQGRSPPSRRPQKTTKPKEAPARRTGGEAPSPAVTRTPRPRFYLPAAAHPDFTFADAEAQLDYLEELGVTDPTSPHPDRSTRLDPRLRRRRPLLIAAALGGRDGFESLADGPRPQDGDFR